MQHQKIMEGCPLIYDKIEIMNTFLYWYPEQGINFLVRFVGLNGKPPKLEIVNSNTSPLTGDNLRFNSTVTVPYGSNLFYSPVPFEFLKTYETKP